VEKIGVRALTTSGTYNFDPSLGELVLYAYNLIGVRPTSVLQEHMQSARMATNMLLSSFSLHGINLWAVDLVDVPLVTGQATYSVDPNTVFMLDAYVVSSGQDRIITPISRTEYASYPDKEQQGFTTVFWFNRQLSPVVTLWPVPDASVTTNLKYYRMRQIQDSNLQNGQTVEIPNMWMEAFADGLAYRLSRIWAPQMSQALNLQAKESLQLALDNNIEQANTYITPMLSSYWRN